MRKYFISLLIVFGLLYGVFVSIPDGKLHLVFCDVGQGDAILIFKGNTQVLIDGGPDDKVLQCLSEHIPFWDRKLEMVVLTHPDSDHLTGLISVVERYDVMYFVANSLINDTGAFSKLQNEVITKNVPIFSPKNRDKIRLANLNFRVLFPPEKLGNEIVWKSLDESKVLGIQGYGGDFNKTSIVLQLDYGHFKAIFPGDISESEEMEIKDSVGSIDVLKVPHHGSKYSASTDFFERIKPKLAVISVGANNRYGHPASQVLEQFKNMGIKILRTDKDGEVEVVSDGENWKIENGK